MLHVEEAEYRGDYRIWMRFNEGTQGEVDLAKELEGEVFYPLKALNYFRRVQLSGHTVAWPNGADFAPEYLRDLLRRQYTEL